MHKSRLAGFIIDCKTADLPKAAEFWGQALNMELHGLNERWPHEFGQPDK